MKVEHLNNVLRQVIEQLINDGHKKKPICDGTLGSQSNPQFEGFMKGKDLGIKPLTRLMEGLGYEIFTIPVKKNNKEMFEFAENNMMVFADDAKSQLLQYLENRPVSERGSRNAEGTMTGALQDDISKILDNLDKLE